MDPGEVAEVDEVLDPPRGAAVPVVLRDLDLAIGRVEPTPGTRAAACAGVRRRRQTQMRPGVLDRRVAGDPGLARDVRPVAGRDPGADAVRVVGPAVVGADEVVVLDPAERQRRPAVDAQVLERPNLAVEADEDDRLVEQARRHRSVAELVGPQHRVPEPTQRAVQRRLAGPVQHVVGHVAAAAKLAMSGKTRSGTASAGGVAPEPTRSWRRSIQTVVMPSDLAGTWSWNRLWATCRIRSRGTSIRSKASSKLASRGL